jgi:hypothetical protein
MARHLSAPFLKYAPIFLGLAKKIVNISFLNLQ